MTTALGRVILSEQRKVLSAGVRARRREQNGKGSGRHGSDFQFRPFSVPLALSGALLFTLDDASNKRPDDPVASKILKAAKRGDAASVERLISEGKGVDVNARDAI